MTAVLTEICDWALGSLQYWERATLDKILSGTEFDEADYEELLKYLLEDAGLAEAQDMRPKLHFPERSAGRDKSDGPVCLVKISDLHNVNALVPEQTLTFCPSLTAIYGGNGSGKSGYARVLGCAGFTRGDEEVLPDVTKPFDDNAVLSARIEVACGDSQQVISYEVGRRCPELASFYVFDSTSVRAHLTGSNAFSFCPAGLSYLTRLAEETDSVRACLKTRIEEYSKPHEFDRLFQGTTVVSEFVAGLGPDTDIADLRELATLSLEERNQIDELDLEIAQLKAREVPAEMTRLEQRIKDLGNLADRLREAAESLDDQVLEHLLGAAQICIGREQMAEQASVDQFKSEHFTQIGGDAWYEFIAAARTLAEAEGTPGQPYPQPEDRCLLCRQPLTPGAHTLLLRLWDFLKGEA